ncbi:MAG: nuclear transport factor 2 family protein [Oenococcus sp.]|uniref:nuclear transport factor 2 family protein n=1 Tax=Oenococcus sp. TaxID=1979414 RepID=UPI0039E8E3FF
MTAIPQAIHSFITATNEANDTAFVNAFTPDAYLEDWGRVFSRHNGVASWNRSDNIGKHSHFDFVSIKDGSKSDEYIVTLKVTGGGYNGTSDMVMTVAGDKISRLIISA